MLYGHQALNVLFEEGIIFLACFEFIFLWINSLFLVLPFLFIVVSNLFFFIIKSCFMEIWLLAFMSHKSLFYSKYQFILLGLAILVLLFILMSDLSNSSLSTHHFHGYYMATIQLLLDIWFSVSLFGRILSTNPFKISNDRKICKLLFCLVSPVVC